MEGGRLRGTHLRGLHHRDAQHVLGVPGEGYLVRFGIGDRLVGEYVAVNEAFEGVDVHSQRGEDFAGVIVPLAHHAQEEVVRPYAVAACPHGLLAGVTDDAVELVRYFYFHIVLNWMLPKGNYNNSRPNLQQLCESSPPATLSLLPMS